MYLISESEDSFLPKLRCSESMSSLPLSSESESQHENLIITFEEFYEFLKEMWIVAANYLTHDDELVELELDDILTPGDASIEELIKYFIYCCELETKHKLHIQQDIVYGPVNIIKI
ncbi:PREDICTED: uncharacterized protein LOC105365382 [Ceratosolen solmsi marchali]|uniref:Uncharacterized protein LOC105365382 n=1 Tax=Ceratosolen solmsi marchali TaxID=326594 RepID=A0AAJ7DZ80_9HYME|nr:PREDICTED: uncharacterized protein LOC105365382 [Ceratosolen solmsi marchali]